MWKGHKLEYPPNTQPQRAKRKTEIVSVQQAPGHHDPDMKLLVRGRADCRQRQKALRRWCHYMFSWLSSSVGSHTLLGALRDV